MMQHRVLAGIAMLVAIPQAMHAQTAGTTARAAQIDVAASCLGDQAQAVSLSYSNQSRPAVAGVQIIKAGDRLQVRGEIKNPCTSGTRVIPWYMLYGSVAVRSGTLTLAPGETKVLDYEWGALRGSHTFKIVADPAKTLNETNRANNTRTATILVTQ